jgi:hypothetical protein
MDPERIWLQPDCGQCAAERCWCQDELEACEDCGARPVEYIRADVAHALYAAGQRDMLGRASCLTHERSNSAAVNNLTESHEAYELANRMILALEIKESPQ